MYKVTYPTVASMEKDEVALEVLGEILLNFKSSPLYNTFINPKAVSANAQLQSN
ncbi:MAG: hypothetical protein IPH32_09950 [Bacteroidetes bacterium]|nr:hypothetical protein [Bacteroidota bacterium]